MASMSASRRSYEAVVSPEERLNLLRRRLRSEAAGANAFARMSQEPMTHPLFANESSPASSPFESTTSTFSGTSSHGRKSSDSTTTRTWTLTQLAHLPEMEAPVVIYPNSTSSPVGAEEEEGKENPNTLSMDEEDEEGKEERRGVVTSYRGETGNDVETSDLSKEEQYRSWNALTGGGLPRSQQDASSVSTEMPKEMGSGSVLEKLQELVSRAKEEYSRSFELVHSVSRTIPDLPPTPKSDGGNTSTRNPALEELTSPPVPKTRPRKSPGSSRSKNGSRSSRDRAISNRNMNSVRSPSSRSSKRSTPKLSPSIRVPKMLLDSSTKNAKAVYELPEGILVIEKDGTPVLYEQEEYEPQSVDSPSRITPIRHSSRSKTSSPLVSGRQPSTPSSSRRSLKQPLRDESTPGRNSLKSAPQHASAPPHSTMSNSFSPKSRSVPSVLDRDLSTVSEDFARELSLKWESPAYLYSLLEDNRNSPLVTPRGSLRFKSPSRERLLHASREIDSRHRILQCVQNPSHVHIIHAQPAKPNVTKRSVSDQHIPDMASENIPSAPEMLDTPVKTVDDSVAELNVSSASSASSVSSVNVPRLDLEKVANVHPTCASSGASLAFSAPHSNSFLHKPLSSNRKRADHDIHTKSASATHNTATIPQVQHVGTLPNDISDELQASEVELSLDDSHLNTATSVVDEVPETETNEHVDQSEDKEESVSMGSKTLSNPANDESCSSSMNESQPSNLPEEGSSEWREQYKERIRSRTAARRAARQSHIGSDSLGIHVESDMLGSSTSSVSNESNSAVVESGSGDESGSGSGSGSDSGSRTRDRIRKKLEERRRRKSTINSLQQDSIENDESGSPQSNIHDGAVPGMGHSHRSSISDGEVKETSEVVDVECVRLAEEEERERMQKAEEEERERVQKAEAAERVRLEKEAAKLEASRIAEEKRLQEEKEKVFKVALRRGALFKKHRKNKSPAERTIKTNLTYKTLWILDSSNAHEEEINTSDITEVRVGTDCHIVQNRQHKGKPEWCIELVLPDRVIELEATSEDVFESFSGGFHWLAAR